MVSQLSLRPRPRSIRDDEAQWPVYKSWLAANQKTVNRYSTDIARLAANQSLLTDDHKPFRLPGSFLVSWLGPKIDLVQPKRRHEPWYGAGIRTRCDRRTGKPFQVTF